MVIDQQRQDYLDEHLPYELKMLRYTYGQMLQRQHYLSWNAHFESFATHAANLVRFLTNTDTGNFKASDFVKGGYRARIGDAHGAMEKLKRQVFHLAKNRPKTVIDKFSTEPHAKEVFEWIETNFADFLSKLGQLRKFFNDKKADPSQDEGLFIMVGPTGPGASVQTACTASPIVNQTHTASAAFIHGSLPSTKR